MRIGDPQPNTRSRPQVIGIDGGGTKTVAWLAHVNHDQYANASINVIGQGSAGGSNATTRGADAAAQAVVQAASAAFDDAGLAPRPVDAMVCGLAGTGDPGVRAAVDRAIRQTGIARTHLVTDDMSPVLRAAADAQAAGSTQAKTTIVIASGTGSIAWAQDTTGNTVRAGGLGPTVGDPGSAYAIGLAAIQHAQQAQASGPGDDGLVDVVLRGLNLSGPDALARWLSTACATPPTIAALAEHVIRAHGRSPAAQQIIDASASALARFIASIYKQLAATPGDNDLLVMTGGVLCRQDTVRRALLSCLHRQAISPARWITVSDPVLGATHWAADLLEADNLPE